MDLHPSEVRLSNDMPTDDVDDVTGDVSMSGSGDAEDSSNTNDDVFTRAPITSKT